MKMALLALVGTASLGALGFTAGTGRLATTAAVSNTVAMPSAPVYGVDAVHSGVIFRTKHAGITNFYGRFNKVDGTWSFDPESPEEASFEFTVDNNSVDTGNSGRDDHLRNPDFFNTRQFPTTTFESTKVEKSSGENMYKLHGDLTLHGVTKPVVADLEYLGTGEFRGNPIAAFEARFTIKRSEFGMTKYIAPDGSDSGGLGNTVHLIVSVEGPRQ
jgi:polyisoprenoid-binding protein YceI